MESTRSEGTSRFPPTTLLFLTNGRKDACHRPAAATAGFLMFVLTDLMPFCLSAALYRRSFPTECFASNCEIPCLCVVFVNAESRFGPQIVRRSLRDAKI